MKKYPDWFAAVGKNMVKKPDGTCMLVTPDEKLSELKKENKITLTKLEEIRTSSLHLILILKTV
jgi:hypothetical protein